MDITLTIIIITVRKKHKAGLMNRAPTKMFIKVAWYSVITCIAIVAVGVELDRQGRTDHWAAAIVPEPFRSDALERLARRSYDSGDKAEGEAFARSLVERRPIPAEALSLYAAGLLANGNEEAGAAALQLAAGRGWRDRFVQRVVILSALQQGRPQIAANRVVGLWRIGEREDWLKDLTRATLEAPGGLPALEKALVVRDKYFGTEFLVWATAKLPLEIVDRLANQMAARQSEFNCQTFSSQTEKLVRYGDIKSVSAVWNKFCASGRFSSVNDLSFNTTDTLPGPFDWHYPANPGIDVEVRQVSKDVLLHYSSSDPLLRVIARRYLAVEPGRHVLKVDRKAAISGADWRITCIAADGHRSDVKLDPAVDAQWSFVVQAACPVQELSIGVRASSGDIGGIRLSEVD